MGGYLVDTIGFRLTSDYMAFCTLAFTAFYFIYVCVYCNTIIPQVYKDKLSYVNKMKSQMAKSKKE